MIIKEWKEGIEKKKKILKNINLEHIKYDMRCPNI